MSRKPSQSEGHGGYKWGKWYVNGGYKCRVDLSNEPADGAAYVSGFLQSPVALITEPPSPPLLDSTSFLLPLLLLLPLPLADYCLFCWFLI